MLIIIDISYFKLSDNQENNMQMVGILEDDIYNPQTEFLGDFNKDKVDAKFAGYIIGENVESKDNEIREDFSTRTIDIFGAQLKIPDFMQYFSPVEISGGLINLVPNKDEVGNELNKNHLSIYVSENDDLNSPEKYLENEKKIFGDSEEINKYLDTSKKLESHQMDDNTLKLYFNGDYKNFGDNSANTRFNEYQYLVFENNKIYNVSYRYQDSDVGNEVIQLINSSFKLQ